jgi:hypothetical protein
MQVPNTLEHKLSGIVLRSAIMVIGILTIPIAIVWLPVFGLFFSALIIGIALSPSLFVSRDRSVRVFVGSRTNDYSNSNRLIPVTIVPGQEQTFADGYATAGIIPESVRLEHNDEKPVYSPFTPASPAAYTSKINDSAGSDMTFYFSERAVDEAGHADICITAETMDGALIRGCSHTAQTA